MVRLLRQPGDALGVLLACHSVLLAACLRGSQRSSGGVVRQDAQITLKLPDKYDFGAPGNMLTEVHVDEKVADPEGGVDMLITMSVDPDNRLHLHSGTPGNGGSTNGKDGWVPLAWAKYQDTVNKTGWGYLSVGATAQPGVSDDLKVYAAGFLEGFSSAKQIRDFQHNANALMSSDEASHSALGNIRTLFGNSIKTIQNKSGMEGSGVVLSESSQPEDPWWLHARYMLMQAWGLMDAYNLHANNLHGTPMSMVDLFILNSDGETPELEMAYDFQEVLLRQSNNGGGDASSTDDDESGKVFLQKRRGLAKNMAHHTDRGIIGDLGLELRSKARERRMQTMRSWNDKTWRKFKQKYGRCSALVRLTEDGSDLMVGHTTFSDFSEMNRIYKYYDFPLKSGASQRMGFSSYPGVMGSTDDFYVIDTGLVITETTVSMLSDEAFDKLDDNSGRVPDYMRIMMANRLAKTGEEWVDYMKQSATGTYNSQWMVVDYKLFQPGQELKPGTFWVLEQAPGASHAEDMSSRLQSKKFWGSENRGFFDDVRKLSGEAEAEETQGVSFSADRNPRGHIFSETAPSVANLADMRAELRRNRWPHEVDGGPGNTPDHAIAARGDLAEESPRPNGGVDSKVTNACLAKQLAADAISGPTHDTQKPFKWTDANGKSLYPDFPRDGQPDLWNFDWARMTPDQEMLRLPTGDCTIGDA